MDRPESGLALPVPGIDTSERLQEGEVRDRLAELLTSAFEESGMTIRELAISIRGGDDESSIKRVRERLEAKVLSLEELVQISKTLRISPDALMRALFPDLPNDRSLIL